MVLGALAAVACIGGYAYVVWKANHDIDVEVAETRAKLHAVRAQIKQDLENMRKPRV